ncbi:hypothetical protein [uncultured Limosilactobacillus sp.]|uniref:hypothetical protein n=1 Tax=uncultured Limosilactobacillus sp. TaxID=2837629 RepID=UPI0025F6AD7D|nr:hypothetical protein [uncultured Limosilactobacillus sp.]
MDDFLMIFIVAFLVFMFLLLKFGKKGHFDERQELIRGQGFKYGFWAMMLADALLLLVTRKIPLSPPLLLLTSMFIGLWVFSVYALWNSAYFAMNQKKIKRLSWVFLLLGVLYGIQSITDLATTSLNLQSWDPDFGLLILAIYFMSVGGLMVYCYYRDQHKRD